ncbi:hypothetical protein [Mesorhizobium kowhaii]|uniref:hypothetical protein n=1 Tax=Mesorhizobium kowhaii TaxID=1300272 RepID=UPI00142E7A34|nr:hypothetical protein [Mesorhizobium kowhaii]
MRRLETIQTVAKNSAACSVEISPDVIAPSLARGLPATVPTPPMTAAAMLILRTQDSAFDFVSIFVTGCFRCVNFACGPYPDHAAWSRALLPIGFEIDDLCFVCRNSHFRLGENTHVRDSGLVSKLHLIPILGSVSGSFLLTRGNRIETQTSISRNLVET